MRTTRMAALAILAALFLSQQPAARGASQTASVVPRLEISPLGYRITGIQPVPGIPGALDVTSRAGVCGDAATGVSARLTSLSPRLIVVDGDVDFGRVRRTSCVRPIISQDTFTLRVILPGSRHSAQLQEFGRLLLQSLSWTLTCDACVVNHPPVANAGPDQTAYIGQAASLNGTGSSDVDGDPLSYSWSLASRPDGSVAELTGASESVASLTPDIPGEYVVHLVVHDGTVASTPDEVIVSTLNSRPVADAGPDQTVYVGDTAWLDGSRSADGDGDAVAFRWSLVLVPTGSTATLDDPNTDKPAFGVDRPGTYLAQLIVNDGTANSDADTVVVSTINSAPRADAGPAQTVHWNSILQLDGTASADADRDALTYTWSMLSRPDGSQAALQDAGTSNPSFRPDRAGSYVAQLIVNDGTVDSAPATVTITATNQAPLAADDLAGTIAGTAVDVEVLINDSDPDGDPLAVASASPPTHGTTTIVAGRIRYTPGDGFTGTDSFVYSVTDGAESATTTVTVLVGPPPPPPPGPVARLELAPSAVLLTGPDDVRVLEVRAFDAAGAPTFVAADELEYVSSNEEQIRVVDGAVQALVIPGSALVRARWIIEPSIVSPPVAVTAASVNSAVIVISDEEIVSEPVVLDVADRRYEVRLNRLVEAGTLILNSGGKPVMGRVVSVDPSTGDGTFRTEVRLAPLNAFFHDLTLSYSFTSNELSGLIREEVPLLAALNSEAAMASALENSRACRLDFNFTEATADLAGNVRPEVGYDSDVTISEGNLERFKVVVSGSLTASLNLTASINAAAQIDGSCEKKLATIVVPIGGPLALLIGARVPIGLKGSLSLAMQQNLATLTVAQDLQTDMVLGVHYERGQGFLPVNTLSVGTTTGDTFIDIPPSSLRFRGKAFLGGTAKISLGVFGSGFDDALFALVDLNGGPQFEARFGEPYDVSTDPAYTAEYDLKVVGKVGPGADIITAFDEIFGSLVQPSNLTLEFEEPWATSPRAGGVLKADRAAFSGGDVVTFRVDLDPGSESFPVVGHNVSEIRVYFRDEASSTARLVASTPGIPGKISYELPWTADRDGRTVHPTTGRDNFFAFVVPVLLSTVSSAYPLELGPVRGVSPIEIIPHEVTLATGGTRQFSARTDGDDATNVTWTATGGTISSTGFYRAGTIPGTYTVTVARADAPHVTDEATVEIRPHCAQGAGTGYCGFNYATQPHFGLSRVAINDNSEWVAVIEDDNDRRTILVGRADSYAPAIGLDPPATGFFGVNFERPRRYFELTNTNAFAASYTGPSGFPVAFVFQNGAKRILDPLSGDLAAVAHDVSDDLVVVGESGGRAVRWVNGVAEDLGFGHPSRAYAISADGRILVSSGQGPQSSIHIWHDGNVTTLSDSSYCVGADINSRGDVVGSCAVNPDPANFDQGDFVWRNGGRQRLDGAYAINDNGDILATFAISAEHNNDETVWRDGVGYVIGRTGSYVSFPPHTTVHGYSSISRTKSLLGGWSITCPSASNCTGSSIFIGYPIELVIQ